MKIMKIYKQILSRLNTPYQVSKDYRYRKKRYKKINKKKVKKISKVRKHLLYKTILVKKTKKYKILTIKKMMKSYRENSNIRRMPFHKILAL